MEIQAFASAVAPQPHGEAAYAELVGLPESDPQEVLGLEVEEQGWRRLIGLQHPNEAVRNMLDSPSRPVQTSYPFSLAQGGHLH